MLGALEVILITVILGGLLLLQARARAGSLMLYMTIGILLLMLIFAMRIIRSLLGVLIALGFICAILLWRIARSR